MSDDIEATEAGLMVDRATGSKDWDDLPAVMKLNDLASFFGVGYRRALEMCHIRDFPSMKVGRGWRINRDALRRWLCVFR